MDSKGLYDIVSNKIFGENYEIDDQVSISSSSTDKVNTQADDIMILENQNNTQNSGLTIFEFPTADFKQKKWISAEQVKSYLNEKCKFKDPYTKGVLYRQVFSDRRIIYQCRLCTSRIIFSCDAKMHNIHLVSFDGKHDHKNKGEKMRQLQEKVFESLEETPFDLLFQIPPQKLADQFEISLEQAKSYFKKFIHKYNRISKLKGKLEKQQYGQFYSTFKNITKNGKEKRKRYFLFMITTAMREFYKKYGDYVFLNSVEGLLLDESAEVVFFTGQDTHLRVVLLGIGIVWQADEISYVNLIREFFEAMGAKPNCVITSLRKEVCDAIKSIKKKFKKDHKWNHLIYASAIKQQFAKKIDKDQDNFFKNVSQKEQFVNQCQDAIKQYSLQRYQSLIKGLKKKSKTEYLTEVVKRIHDEKRKYCYSQIYGTMCGFGLDDDRVDSFQSCLKKNFEKGNFVKFFYFVFNYEKNYLTRVSQFKPIKNAKQIAIGAEMKILSQKIEGNVMNEIMQNFNQAKNMKVLLMKNSSQMRFQSSLQTHYAVSFEKQKQTVKRRSKNDGWQCSCNYRNLTGLPCKHLLAVLCKENEQISPYINARWFYGDLQALQKEPWFAVMMKKKLDLKIEEYLHDSYIDIQEQEDEGEGGEEESGEDDQDLEIQNVNQGFVPNGIIQLDPQLKNLKTKTKKEIDNDNDSMNSEDHFIAKTLMQFQEEN